MKRLWNYLFFIFFIILPNAPAFAGKIALECVSRVEVDDSGNYRFDQARLGYDGGAGARHRVWAEFNINSLAGKTVTGVGFRVYNDWDGTEITTLRYSGLQPSVALSSLKSQHTASNKYSGFSWTINPGDAWAPNDTNFFIPDWSAWSRSNGNTLIQDINAHINSGSGWFAVEFDCFNCTDRPNLRFSPPNDANPWSIVMEVETAEPFELVATKNTGLCCGSCGSCPSAGNPINFATGNKYEIETDVSLSGPGLPMKYTRYYNSQSLTDETLGYGWTGDFSEHVVDETDKLVLHEADGRQVYFFDDGDGGYLAESDDHREITAVSGGGWKMRSPSGMNGRLMMRAA